MFHGTSRQSCRMGAHLVDERPRFPLSGLSHVGTIGHPFGHPVGFVGDCDGSQNGRHRMARKPGSRFGAHAVWERHAAFRGLRASEGWLWAPWRYRRNLGAIDKGPRKDHWGGAIPKNVEVNVKTEQLMLACTLVLLATSCADRTTNREKANSDYFYVRQSKDGSYYHVDANEGRCRPGKNTLRATRFHRDLRSNCRGVSPTRRACAWSAATLAGILRNTVTGAMKEFGVRVEIATNSPTAPTRSPNMTARGPSGARPLLDPNQ